MRALYVTLATMGWYVLLPLSTASLGTGMILSLGTPWGLVRHYRVVIKLALALRIVALTLSVYKPRGLTSYGRSRRRAGAEVRANGIGVLAAPTINRLLVTRRHDPRRRRRP